MTIPYEAVICDHDGLLVDSERLWPEIDQAFFSVLVGGAAAWQAYAPVWQEQRREAVKLPVMIRGVLDRFGRDDDPEEIRRRREDFLLDEYRKRLEEKSGATDLLVAAAAVGMPVAIGSGTSPRIMRTVIEHLRWERLIRATASTYETGRQKPDPSVFLLAAERLGARPERCLVLENEEIGYRAARTAGMDCLTVPDTERRRAECLAAGATVLGSLRDVLDTFRTVR